LRISLFMFKASSQLFCRALWIASLSRLAGIL
jgi:hypothetical protein